MLRYNKRKNHTNRAVYQMNSPSN